MILRRSGDVITIPREPNTVSGNMYPAVRQRIVWTYKSLRRSDIPHRFAKGLIWDMVFAMYLYHPTTPVTFESSLL